MNSVLRRVDQFTCTSNGSSIYGIRNNFKGRRLLMVASNELPTVPPAPIMQWENEGGAIPSVAKLSQSSWQINVGNAERTFSAITGGALLLHGLFSRSLSG